MCSGFITKCEQIGMKRGGVYVCGILTDTPNFESFRLLICYLGYITAFKSALICSVAVFSYLTPFWG